MPRTELIEFQDGALAVRCAVDERGRIRCPGCDEAWLDITLDTIDHSAPPPLCPNCAGARQASDAADANGDDPFPTGTQADDPMPLIMPPAAGLGGAGEALLRLQRRMREGGWAYLSTHTGGRPMLRANKVHFVRAVGGNQWLSLCGFRQVPPCRPAFYDRASPNIKCRTCEKALASIVRRAK